MARSHTYLKRRQKKHRSRRLVDKLTLAAAIIEPLATVPQAVTIFIHHTAAGVSLSTWCAYEIMTIIWLWYGFAHKEKMILVYQGGFFIAQTAIIIGALVYGPHW